MWKVKATVVPVVTVTLGYVTPKLDQWLQQISEMTSLISVQMRAVLETDTLLHRTLKFLSLKDKQRLPTG